MLRAVLAATGTVAGLAALFSFKTHTPGVTPVAAPSPAALTHSAPPASNSPSAAPAKHTVKKKSTASPSASRTTAPAGTQHTTPAVAPTTMAPTTTAPTTQAPATFPTTPKASSPPAKAAPSPTPTPTKSSAPTTQQFQGPDESTQYGDVQVAITVSGGKITNASDVIQPADSIGSNAVGQLNQEVLTAQSANIQAVSGATFTSNGYIQSLQQAVDQAGL